MRLFFTIALLGCLMPFSSFKPSGTIYIADFGAVADDGINDAAAIRKAFAFLKWHPGYTLFFAPGIYDFRDEQGAKLTDEVMAGKMGMDPEKIIFTPYYPYAKGLDFNGLRNITMNANGATLLCDGWIEAVSIENCSQVTINGLTIDYKRKPYSIGKITDMTDSSIDLVFDSIYPVTAGIPIPRMTFWDPVANHMTAVKGIPKSVELMAPQKLRVFAKTDSAMQHKWVIIPHSFHYRPAILMQEASSITLNDVTIHSNCGMGITGHRAKDILLNRLQIVPAPGSVFSTNTDATHFTSCTGYLRMNNCRFEGHGDDATNIHNYYYSLSQQANEKGYDLAVKSPTFTHTQVLDYPDVGDSLELVDKSSLATLKKLIVTSRVNDIPGLKTHVTLNELLPADIDNYYLVNATRLPRVEINACSFTAHLARSILIKSRNVLIQNCLFRESGGTGIYVGAEANWHEGLVSSDVIIKNNRFYHCATVGSRNGASAISVEINAKNKKVVGLHKNIIIENNSIEGSQSEYGIYVSGAKDVTILNNKIAGCKTPVKIKYSSNVMLFNNTGMANGKGISFGE